MHKMIATVFKILGMSLIMMFLLDMTLLAVDSLTVHSKITSVAGVMQNEIARNNCMPDSLSLMFKGQLQTVIDQSDVATEVKTNLSSNLISEDGGVYASISQDNAGEYGDLIPLVIEVNMSPWKIVMGNSALSMRKVRDGMDYKLTYVYHVPCLRYLK